MSNSPAQLLDRMSEWSSQIQIVDRNAELTLDDKRALMKTIVQAAIDAMSETFSSVGNEVMADVRAGGERARGGSNALTYLQNVAIPTYEHALGLAKDGSVRDIFVALLETVGQLQTVREMCAEKRL